MKRQTGSPGRGGSKLQAIPTRPSPIPVLALASVWVMVLAAFGGRAWAGTEDHGGEVTYVDGQPVPREARDGSVYRCEPGIEFRERLTEWPATLAKLAQWNGYAAFAYDRELSRLEYCWSSAPLKPIPTEDVASVYSSYADRKRTVLAGRRHAGSATVWLAGRVFFKMAPKAQAEFVFHELTHSFLRSGDPLRNSHNRSFVALVMEYQSPVRNAASFHYQTRAFEIELPTSEAVLVVHRANLEVALNPEAKRAARVRGAVPAREVIGELRPEDAATLRELLDLDRALWEAVADDDADSVIFALAHGASPLAEKGGRTLLESAYALDARDAFGVLLARAEVPVSPGLMLAVSEKSDAKTLSRILKTGRVSTEAAVALIDRYVEDGERELLAGVLAWPELYASADFGEILSRTPGARSEAEYRLLSGLSRGDAPVSPARVAMDAISRGFEGVALEAIELDPGKAKRIRSQFGESLLALAAVEGLCPVIQKMASLDRSLLEHPNQFGNRPLHQAVLADQAAAVSCLVKLGASKTATNLAGKTPRQLALDHGLKAVAKLVK